MIVTLKTLGLLFILLSSNHAYYVESNARLSLLFTDDDYFTCMKWTPWLSADMPSLNGEWETVSSPDDMGLPGTINRYTRGYRVCTTPVSVECRSRFTNVSWVDSYEEFKVPCITNQGLVCITRDQAFERLCRDYEVRFLCWKPCPHFKWSSWLNFDSPEGEGDIEILGETIPREAWPCEGGEIPVDVECETSTGIPVHQSKKRGLRCHNLGFSCLNALQSPDCSCNDFKVRFLCPVNNYFPSGYETPPVFVS